MQLKLDVGNAALSDNDEVSLQLKTFVEKLDAEKTDLENQLHELQRWVVYHMYVGGQNPMSLVSILLLFNCHRAFHWNTIAKYFVIIHEMTVV